MITICSVLFFVFIIWATFKILPAIIGFAFSVLLAILQIIGVLLFVPIIGTVFLLVDVLFIGLIVVIIKAILKV